MAALKLDYCNAVVGSSMSYLVPPPRHQTRIHTRDKVLTPFRTRSSSADRTVTDISQTPPTDTASCSSDGIQQQTWSSSNEAAIGSSRRQQNESPDDFDNTSSQTAANYRVEMTSAASQRTQPVPVIVENFDTKVTRSSVVTSSVSAGAPVWPPTASSSSQPAAAGNRPATAPKPATKILSAAELASQHHLTGSYNPSSAVIMSSQAEPTSQSTHLPNLASSSEYSHVSVRPSRSFSPTTRAAEPPSIADSRPWSPRMAQHCVPDHWASQPAYGVSGSQQPPANRFAPAQRSLSPPVKPAGFVRVPYVPTPAAARSSSVGANARVLPPSPADRKQLATSPSPSLSLSSAAVNVSSPGGYHVNNTVVVTTVTATSKDTPPFSPTNRYIGDQSTSQLAGYRKVAAPNPNSFNTKSVHDNRTSGIPQTQNQSLGTITSVPSSRTQNSVSSGTNLQPLNLQEGYTSQGQQRSDVFRQFSPEFSQVDLDTRAFSPNNAIYHPVEEAVSTSQQPNVSAFNQPYPPNYQQFGTATRSGTSQARHLNPQTNDVPPMNYQSQPMMHQQPGISIMSGQPQTRPFSPQSSQVPSINYHPQPLNYQQTDTSAISGTSQTRPFSPQINQVPPMNCQPQPITHHQSEASTMSSQQPQTRPFGPHTSQVPSVNYHSHTVNNQQPATTTISSTSQIQPSGPQATQTQSLSYQPHPVNYQQPETSAMLFQPQNRPFSPQITQISSVNYPTYPISYQQPETPTVSGTSEDRPFSPQTSQVPPGNYGSQPVNYQQPRQVSSTSQTRPFSPHATQVQSLSYQHYPANYQQLKTSTISSSSQERPFSPQTSQVPSVNYQHLPTKYQQPETFTVPSEHQSRPFSPQTTQIPPVNYQSPPVSYQQPGTCITSGAPQKRPLNPPISQVQSVSYQPLPSNYQQPKTSSMPIQPQTRPFSPQTTFVPSMNYETHPANFRQPENTTMSGTPQVRPLGPQTSQVPATSIQANSANYRQPGISTIQGPPSTKTFSPHIGVKQHVQRFSTQNSAQVNGSYPRQQQQHHQRYAARTKAPAMMPHDGFDASARLSQDAVHENVRAFSPRSIQSPTDNSIANEDHGQTWIPAAQLVSSIAFESEVNGASSEQSFSPTGAQVTWAMTPPAHAHPAAVPASLPTAWTHDVENTSRPFSPRAALSTSAGERQSGGYITERGTDRNILQEMRPFSPPATDKSITPTQVHTKPTESIDILGQRAVDYKPYEEPRHQAAYPNSRPVAALDSTTSHGIDNRLLSPSGDKGGRQLAYSHVTSPTFGSTDSSVSQKLDSRPFSPSADQSTRQPTYQLVNSSIAVDSFVGQRTDRRPFSPSSVTDVNQSIDRALSPTARPFSPAVSSSSLQRPSSAPSSSVSGGADGSILGYRRICFSPVPEPMRPAQRASPIPLMMSQQPAVAIKESRISVSGARLVLAPRRGSDVTASTPSYLTSCTARTQLNVLRENQVADWKDSRTPVIWIPTAPTAGRSRSLEPISGTAIAR